MRSTVVLPDELIEEAKRATGLKTKREVIETVLLDYVRRWRLERFRSRLGKIEFDLTQDELERMRAED